MKSQLFFFGITYPSAESAYQAQKSTDINVKLQFQTITPGKAKRLGRQIELRTDWEDIKVEMMEYTLRAKFSDPDLQDMLLSTGDAILIEGNNWDDTYWGACEGVGQNMLGVLLMKVRDELKG